MFIQTVSSYKKSTVLNINVKMKKKHLFITGLIVSFVIGFYTNNIFVHKTIHDISIKPKKENYIKLGAFSISLNVK